MIYYVYIATEKNNFNIVWMSQVDFIVISESRLKGIFSRQKLSCPCRIWQFFFKYNNYSFLRAQHFTTRLCITDETCRLFRIIPESSQSSLAAPCWDRTGPFCALVWGWLGLPTYCYPNYSNNLLNSYSYSIFLFGILLFK